MFDIRGKVYEFIITKDSCTFGVNQMQCVRKYKIRILDNVEFPGRITQVLLLDFDNY